ncbi:hypothetical protein [Saccharomonospora sp. NB11]|uniref:hypothetical protein n=1 Tax=Saccharomonospora sp. NB11 TaxID=1642298 RepID=UPI0027DAB82F|nr:hypothetical protein [Saccharomonospora sp. NB11]
MVAWSSAGIPDDPSEVSSPKPSSENSGTSHCEPARPVTSCGVSDSGARGSFRRSSAHTERR